MTAPLPPPLASQNTAPKKTPGLAIASISLGIFAMIGGALLVIPSILAIVFGHIAHSRIQKDNTLGGSTIAITGFILGYTSFVFIFVLGLLAAMAVPAFQKVRENSIKTAMYNDAVQIAAATQQEFLETNSTSVSFKIDPETGTVSGPLSKFGVRISKGVNASDGVISSPSDTFSLIHPHVNNGKPVVFDLTGKVVGPAASQ